MSIEEEEAEEEEDELDKVHSTLTALMAGLSLEKSLAEYKRPANLLGLRTMIAVDLSFALVLTI